MDSLIKRVSTGVLIIRVTSSIQQLHVSIVKPIFRYWRTLLEWSNGRWWVSIFFHWQKPSQFRDWSYFYLTDITDFVLPRPLNLRAETNRISEPCLIFGMLYDGQISNPKSVMNFLLRLLTLFCFLFCYIVHYSITFASYVEIISLALNFQEAAAIVLQ